MVAASHSLEGVALGEEGRFANVINFTFAHNPPIPDDFLTTLRGIWAPPDLAGLRLRRLLPHFLYKDEATNALEAARQKDVAKQGLQCCALPSCDKREASVGQYKKCGGCRNVFYCSEEHGALHWKEHKPVCRAAAAAATAAAKH